MVPRLLQFTLSSATAEGTRPRVRCRHSGAHPYDVASSYCWQARCATDACAGVKLRDAFFVGVEVASYGELQKNCEAM